MWNKSDYVTPYVTAYKGIYKSVLRDYFFPTLETMLKRHPLKRLGSIANVTSPNAPRQLYGQEVVSQINQEKSIGTVIATSIRKCECGNYDVCNFSYYSQIISNISFSVQARRCAGSSFGQHHRIPCWSWFSCYLRKVVPVLYFYPFYMSTFPPHIFSA